MTRRSLCSRQQRPSSLKTMRTFWILLSRVTDTAAPEVTTEIGAAEAAVMRSALAAAAKVIVSAFMVILQLIVSVTQLARDPMVPWNISIRACNCITAD